MQISVFGLGYVGTVTAACLAQAGHQVVGVDVVLDKVESINAGQSTIVERDVDRMVALVLPLSRTSDGPIAVLGKTVVIPLHGRNIANAVASCPDPDHGIGNLIGCCIIQFPDQLLDFGRKLAKAYAVGRKASTVIDMDDDILARLRWCLPRILSGARAKDGQQAQNSSVQILHSSQRQASPGTRQ